LVLEIVRDHASGAVPRADIARIAHDKYGLKRRASVYDAVKSLAAAGVLEDADDGVSLAGNEDVIPAGSEPLLQ
jgi:hypothetical protein